MVYNADGTRKVPLPPPEKDLNWYIGLAHALWLDLGYLIILVLLLLTLTACVVNTPALRNIESIKPYADKAGEAAHAAWLWTLAQAAALQRPRGSAQPLRFQECRGAVRMSQPLLPRGAP